jgi:hypothetical protein
MLADAQCAACSTVAALRRTPKAFRAAFPPVGLPASTVAAGTEAHKGGVRQAPENVPLQKSKAGGADVTVEVLPNERGHRRMPSSNARHVPASPRAPLIGHS